MLQAARRTFRAVPCRASRKPRQEGFRALPRRRRPQRNGYSSVSDGRTGLECGGSKEGNGGIWCESAPPHDLPQAVVLRREIPRAIQDQHRISKPAFRQARPRTSTLTSSFVRVPPKGEHLVELTGCPALGAAKCLLRSPQMLEFVLDSVPGFAILPAGVRCGRIAVEPQELRPQLGRHSRDITPG